MSKERRALVRHRSHRRAPVFGGQERGSVLPVGACDGGPSHYFIRAGGRGLGAFVSGV